MTPMLFGKMDHNAIICKSNEVCKDTLAERLRRRPAKPMGSPRVGSNPTGVELLDMYGLQSMIW